MFVGCSLPQKIGRKMIPKYDLQILQIAFNLPQKWQNPPENVVAQTNKLGGGFKYFLSSSPIWGRFPIWLMFFNWIGNHQPANKQTNQPTKTRINTHRRWCPFFSQGATSLLLPLWLPLKSPTRRRSKWAAKGWPFSLLNGVFLKWWYPQIIDFNGVFQYKPSILGYPYFWKHPNSEQMRILGVGGWAPATFRLKMIYISCQ